MQWWHNFDFCNGYSEDSFQCTTKSGQQYGIKESSRRFSKTSGFGTNDLKSCMLVQIYTFGKTDKILWDNLAGFLKTQLPKMGSLQLYCQMVTKNSLLGCKQRSGILKRKEITIFNYVRRLLCLSCPTAFASFASASRVLLYHVIVQLQKSPFIAIRPV